MTKYGKITTGLLAVWFVAVFSASAAHLFKNDSAQVGLGVAVAALAPVIVFSLWFAASQEFRNFALSLNSFADGVELIGHRLDRGRIDAARADGLAVWRDVGENVVGVSRTVVARLRGGRLAAEHGDVIV